MPLFAFLEGPDLVIVLIIVLVLFGGSQLPKLARSLGQAQRELQKGLHGAADAADADADAPDTADTATNDDTATKDDTVVLTRAELDALLSAKEAEVRSGVGAVHDQTPPPAG